MVDLKELDGVASGRAENLKEAGYESVEDLVDADAEDLGDEVSYLPEDTALELIVQAQNIVAEEDAEVEESEPESVTDEVAEAVSAEEALEELPDEEEIEEEAEDEDDEVEEDADGGESEPDSASENVEEDDGPEEYIFEIGFETGLEYDTFFDAVMSQRAKMLRSNRTGVDPFDHALEQMRKGGADEPVQLTMTKAQLNDLHNSVRQTSVEYKGDNLIDHMDALKQVLNQINEVREEHLF